MRQNISFFFFFFDKITMSSCNWHACRLYSKLLEFRNNEYFCSYFILISYHQLYRTKCVIIFIHQYNILRKFYHDDSQNLDMIFFYIQINYDSIICKIMLWIDFDLNWTVIVTILFFDLSAQTLVDSEIIINKLLLGKLNKTDRLLKRLNWNWTQE